MFLHVFKTCKMDYITTTCHDTESFVTAFAIGYMFSPFSYGIEYYILYSIISEIIIYYCFRMCDKPYDIPYRLAINLLGFGGWVAGRALFYSRSPLTHFP
jgi:hypothetical protein